VDTPRSQRKRATKEYLEKRYRERNVGGQRDKDTSFKYSWRKIEAAVQERAGWR